MSAPGPRWVEVAKTSDPEHLGNLRRAYEAGRKDAQEKPPPAPKPTPKSLVELARFVVKRLRDGFVAPEVGEQDTLLTIQDAYRLGLTHAAAKVRRAGQDRRGIEAQHAEALAKEIEP